jgi:hypothetical protein
MTRDDIAEQFGEDLLFMEPEYFDRAIIGVVHQFNKTTVCYNIQKVIAMIMKHNNVTEDEAVEYFEYNVIGAWVGDHTPSFLESL